MSFKFTKPSAIESCTPFKHFWILWLALNVFKIKSEITIAHLKSSSHQSITKISRGFLSIWQWWETPACSSLPLMSSSACYDVPAQERLSSLSLFRCFCWDWWQQASGSETKRSMRQFPTSIPHMTAIQHKMGHRLFFSSFKQSNPTKHHYG